jgi:mannose-6-phosphate isomerase-like protein (cupin superfamily)
MTNLLSNSSILRPLVVRRLPMVHILQSVFLIAAMGAACLAASQPARAQSAGATTYSSQQLMGIAAQMIKESQAAAPTNNPLERRLDAATVLIVRTTSGRAEFHATAADAFFVLEGHATLITGGTIVNPQGSTEIRGDSIQGGVRAELKAGDVVHIPASTPHQVLLEGAGPVVYVLFKVPVS